MKEIGSEYWKINKKLLIKDNVSFWKSIGSDIKYFMSGRTAIDYVLKQLEDEKKIVYMPDYCCESMLQPFKDNGYKIEFYKVDIINNKFVIDLDLDCSIFFAMSYFGYSDSNMDNYINNFSKKKVIIIEDITHRFLSKKNHCDKSNFLICSLRKWFPIACGGVAINVNDVFKTDTNKYSIDSEFVSKKNKAMALKRDYINDKINEKDEYLKLFAETNEIFEDYENQAIDKESLKILNHIDIDECRKKRYENATLIEKILGDNKNIILPYKVKNGDVPLFVPIIIQNRDEIREKLIKEKIYCPIHWPNRMNIENEIYKRELSLICDQRYSNLDIEKYIENLIKIVGE